MRRLSWDRPCPDGGNRLDGKREVPGVPASVQEATGFPMDGASVAEIVEKAMSHGWYNCENCGAHYHEAEDHICRSFPKAMSATQVSPDRLDTLIAFAEQCSKPWIGVDVPNALRELREARKRIEELRENGDHAERLINERNAAETRAASARADALMWKERHDAANQRAFDWRDLAQRYAEKLRIELDEVAVDDAASKPQEQP